MPSSIDDPSAGLLGDEEAPGDCHSALRGIGVVTLAFGGLVIIMSMFNVLSPKLIIKGLIG